MRRSQTSGIAGNCSCCLVPALISRDHCCCRDRGCRSSGQSAMPSVSAGTTEIIIITTPTAMATSRGTNGGRLCASRRSGANGTEFDALALREADRLHIRQKSRALGRRVPQRFTRGFEEFNDQASNRGESCPRLADVFADDKIRAGLRNTRDACATRRKTHRSERRGFVQLCSRTRLPLQVRVERADRKKIFMLGSRRHQSAYHGRVTVEEARSKRRHTTGANVAIADRDRPASRPPPCEVIAPFDHLPAKFAVEPSAEWVQR